MNGACPTCGQIALPPARYCRACYTIFPTPRFAVARQQRRTESRSFQLALLLALAVGGWWAYQADTGAPERGPSFVESGTSDNDTGGRSAAGTRNDSSGRGRGETARRRERAERSEEVASGGWLLHLAPARVCGGAGACEVTIRFASGESARFAVRGQSESTSVLIPVAGDGGALLDRHGRASVVPQDGEDRAISIVRPGGRRWIAIGGG